MDAPPIILSPPARERGTYVVRLTVLDEDGQPASLGGLSWTLSHLDGTVINDRLGVPVASVVSPVILLSAADLAVADGEGDDLVLRRLTLVGVYTSTLGNDLPLTEEVYVPVKPLKKVP